ncbi:MAG: hypothetical protein AB7E80_06210 [Hyphomicrobiaceae bacterium]
MIRRSKLVSRAGAVAAGLGLMMLGHPAAQAADLYDDYRPDTSYKDRWGDVDEDEGPRHRYPRYRESRHEPDCVPRDVIRSRLHRQGWRDFDRAQPRGAFVVVEAHRPSGRYFRLRIDRCTGEVLAARPLEPRYVDYRRDRWDEDRPRWRRWARGPRYYDDAY